MSGTAKDHPELEVSQQEQPGLEARMKPELAEGRPHPYEFVGDLGAVELPLFFEGGGTKTRRSFSILQAMRSRENTAWHRVVIISTRSSCCAIINLLKS